MELSKEDILILSIIHDSNLYDRPIDWGKVVRNKTFTKEQIDNLIISDFLEINGNGYSLTTKGLASIQISWSFQ